MEDSFKPSKKSGLNPQQNTSSSLERDARVTFEPKDHKYYIDDILINYSVSEFVAKYFNKFDAHRIASKLSPSHELAGMPVQEIVKIWEQKGQEAREEGTKLHTEIENHLNGKTINNPTVEFQQFLNYVNAHTQYSIYKAEWRVFDEQNSIAGTIDAVFKDKQGKHIICDWKRSKKIKRENPWQTGLSILQHLEDCNYNHYCLQQNIYKAILEKFYGIEIVNMFLIQLHPNLEKYKIHEVKNMERETQALLAAAGAEKDNS